MRRFRLLVAALFLSPFAANAVPIAITGPCPEVPGDTCFTGVDDLDVAGTVYDVFFVEGVYADVLAANPGVATFVGNQALALLAAEALTDAFRATGMFLGTQSASGPNGGWAGADVAFDVAGSTVQTYFVWTGLDQPPSQFSRSGRINWMIFTAATSVPEPGTLALFGMGLAGMGLARRRKKA